MASLQIRGSSFKDTNLLSVKQQKLRASQNTANCKNVDSTSAQFAYIL